MKMIVGDSGDTAKRRSRSQERIKSSQLASLLESQGYRCALTGCQLTPDTASVDHKQPLSKGGSNTIDNLQIVISDINQAKGAMTQERFIAMCREVARYADAKDEEQKSA